MSTVDSSSTYDDSTILRLAVETARRSAMRSYMQSYCIAQAMNVIMAIVKAFTQHPSFEPGIVYSLGVILGPCNGCSRQTTMMNGIRGLADDCAWDWSYSAQCVRMDFLGSAIALCRMSPSKAMTWTSINAWIRQGCRQFSTLGHDVTGRGRPKVPSSCRIP